MEDASDYDKVKLALQTRYNLTEDGYRRMFRTSQPEVGEDAVMFITRIKSCLERWVTLSKIDRTYDGLRDLFVAEQFMDSCPQDLAVNIRQNKLKSLDDIAKSADAFLHARNRQLYYKNKTKE